MEENKFTRLLPVNAWGKYHDWPSAHALRHYISRSHSNGFDRVVRRINKRVLIDEAAFFEWVQLSTEEKRLAITDKKPLRHATAGSRSIG